MRLLLLAAALLFFATPANAVHVIPVPKRFDHPFHGKIYIYHHNLAWLFARGAWAYTYIPKPGSRVCEMHMPWKGRIVTPAVYKTLFWHERGHCNGWPSNHPA